MSIKLEGWFIPIRDANYFQGFWNKRTDRMYLSYHNLPIVKQLCYAALFGNMEKDGNNDACYSPLDCRTCSQKASKFCQRESLYKRRLSYGATSYYSIWRKIGGELFKQEENIKEVIGTPRYESFLEFIEWSALQEYNNFTKREIKEKDLIKPTVIESGFIGLEEISKDPWQQYVAEKIKEGDEECLLYLDSLFSV